MGRTVNGVGSNQYRIRGKSLHNQAPTGSSGANGLLDQIDSDSGSISGIDYRRCGEVWNTGCRAWVVSPGYNHQSHPTVDSKTGVAKNPSTPGILLKHLATDPHVQVRMEVANNLSSPIETLDRLASDTNPGVRYEVAGNPSTSEDTLEGLMSDGNMYVRLRVAGNSCTPTPTLVQLANDQDVNVRDAAVANPNIPDHIRAMVKIAGQL